MNWNKAKYTLKNFFGPDWERSKYDSSLFTELARRLCLADKTIPLENAVGKVIGAFRSNRFVAIQAKKAARAVREASNRFKEDQDDDSAMWMANKVRDYATNPTPENETKVVREVGPEQLARHQSRIRALWRMLGWKRDATGCRQQLTQALSALSKTSSSAESCHSVTRNKIVEIAERCGESLRRKNRRDLEQKLSQLLLTSSSKGQKASEEDIRKVREDQAFRNLLVEATVAEDEDENVGGFLEFLPVSDLSGRREAVFHELILGKDNTRCQESLRKALSRHLNQNSVREAVTGILNTCGARPEMPLDRRVQALRDLRPVQPTTET
jgi:hypothetical protein